MALLPWFASAKAVMALWMAASVSVPDATTPADKIEAYIKDLPQEKRSLLVEQYAGAGMMFPVFLKYRTPPQIYVSCPEEGCAPVAIGNLAIIQSYAPATLGRRTGAADTSGIESTWRRNRTSSTGGIATPMHGFDWMPTSQPGRS